MLIALGVILTVLNIVASISVIRSPSLEKSKLPYQIAFIWLIPIMGAILALSLLREPFRGRQSAGHGSIDGYGDGTQYDNYGNESHDSFGGDIGGDGGGH